MKSFICRSYFADNFFFPADDQKRFLVVNDSDLKLQGFGQTLLMCGGQT